MSKYLQGWLLLGADLARLLGIAITRSSLDSELVGSVLWLLGSSCVLSASATVLNASEVFPKPTAGCCACEFELVRDVHSSVATTPARKHPPAKTTPYNVALDRFGICKARFAKALIEYSS